MRRLLLLLFFVASGAQAREPLRDIRLLHDITDAYTRSVDVDDPQVLTATYPGRTLADFDRDGDAAFGAAIDDALDDASLAVLQFNHDDLDFDADGLLGRIELDCVVGETRLDPASAQTFEGVDDADLDCDGDGMANGAELARGLDPLDGRDARACEVDALEPNDQDPAVLVLEAGGFEADLSLCLDDTDRFAIDVPDGAATLVVSIGFAHGSGDLDARLTDPGGGTAERASRDDDERFEVADPGAGRWVLEVQGARNDYTLRVTVVAPLDCVPDVGEPGAGDDEAPRATSLDFDGAEDERVVEGRRVCPGDVDWFAFDLGEGDGTSVRVDMLGNPAGPESELDLVIFGPGLPREGGPLPLLPNNAGGDGTPDDPFYLEFTAARDNRAIAAGRYYLRVSGVDVVPAQWGDYRLNVQVDRLERLCLPDRFETNNDDDEATAVAVLAGFGREGDDGLELIPGVGRQIDDVTLCARDEDWLALELEAGDDLEVSVAREAPVRGDVQIQIRGPEGRVVGSGRSANAALSARTLDADAGRHSVRIDGLTDTQTFYSVRLRRTPAPIPCEGDGDEPNDVRAAATEVEAGLREGRTLCGADLDEDWYSFDVEALSTVDVQLTFSHAVADLDLEVFRVGVAEALNDGDRAGHTRGDNERVELDNQPAGRYLARVTGRGNAPYALTIDVAPRVFLCEDDPDEPNGVLEAATLLGFEPLERDRQWLCLRAPEEDDFF